MSSQNQKNHLFTVDYAPVAAKFRPIFQRIAAGAVARENNRTLAYDAIQWLKQAGFGAVRVPLEFGGDGLSQKQLFQLLIELATADSNIVQELRGHFAFVEDCLNRHNVVSQALWFERFVQGDIVGNAWTEIGQVAIGEMTTRITASTSGQLLVNGQKYYATGTIFADWIDLLAWDESTNQQVIAVLSTQAKGIDIGDDWNGFGQKTTGSGTLKIDNVEVNRTHILPFSERFNYQTAFYQTVHLATLAGIADNALAVFSQEVRQRTRIYSHGNADLVRNDAQILQIIGQASAQSYAVRSMVLHTAEILDQAYLSQFADQEIQVQQANDAAELSAAQAQVVISELVLNLTTELFNTLGASACATEKQLDRFWRNARVISSHNPIIYKQRAIGDWQINQKPLPYVWQIGNSKTVQSKDVAA